MLWTELTARFESLQPWPNGMPNSSQLEPSYKIKTCIGGWPNDTNKSSQLARNHSIVWIRARSHITIKINNLARVGLSWLRWPNGGKRGSSWVKIWAWSNSSHLDFLITWSNCCRLTRRSRVSQQHILTMWWRKSRQIGGKCLDLRLLSISPGKARTVVLNATHFVVPPAVLHLLHENFGSQMEMTIPSLEYEYDALFTQTCLVTIILSKPIILLRIPSVAVTAKSGRLTHSGSTHNRTSRIVQNEHIFWRFI